MNASELRARIDDARSKYIQTQIITNEKIIQAAIKFWEEQLAFKIKIAESNTNFWYDDESFYETRKISLNEWLDLCMAQTTNSPIIKFDLEQQSTIIEQITKHFKTRDITFNVKKLHTFMCDCDQKEGCVTFCWLSF